MVRPCLRTPTSHANGGPGTVEEECLLGQQAARVLGEQIWDRK
jgi:hypothetical protein